MSDISVAYMTEEVQHDEALEHATSVTRIARDLMHKVITGQDYHFDALLLADHAKLLVDCAAGVHCADYEHDSFDEAHQEVTPPPSLSNEEKTIEQLPTAHNFIALRKDQLSDEYTPRGYRGFNSYCESFETVEEAYNAVKSDPARPLYVAELKENGECAVIYMITKESDKDPNKIALI